MAQKEVHCVQCIYMARWMPESRNNQDSVNFGTFQSEYFCTSPKVCHDGVPVSLDSDLVRIMNDSDKMFQVRPRFLSQPPFYMTPNVADPEDKSFVIWVDPETEDVDPDYVTNEREDGMVGIRIPAVQNQKEVFDAHAVEIYMQEHGYTSIDDIPPDECEQLFKSATTIVEMPVYTQRKISPTRWRDLMMAMEKSCPHGVTRYTWRRDNTPLPIPENVLRVQPGSKLEIPASLNVGKRKVEFPW